MVFQAEAEVRWLDHCEASLARYARSQPTSTADDPPTTKDTTATRDVRSEAKR